MRDLLLIAPLEKSLALSTWRQVDVDHLAPGQRTRPA
jgi:hypothetical protein